jgi:ADP-ribose pyrophosphatase YjhB (NUDIX family)
MIKTSAGLVIIFDNKIFLVHPTNAPWYGSYSIPKGEITEGESLFDTAIRETKEEIGVEFDKGGFRKDILPEFIEYRDKNNKVYKTVWYFTIFLPESLDMSKITLQPEEVDWAGFLDKKEAEKRIFDRFKSILKYLN